MRARFKVWLWELLRALSQLLSVWVRGWRWVWWGDCLPPDSNLTTSAWVGQAAIDGFKWGRLAERHIDAVFGRGHCKAAARRRE